ncbi:MAG: S8 family peptidase [Thaumarchaeota archaeon]|nr:S8 family peptidase [Nitrososphaerota archaeon]
MWKTPLAVMMISLLCLTMLTIKNDPALDEPIKFKRVLVEFDRRVDLTQFLGDLEISGVAGDLASVKIRDNLLEKLIKDGVIKSVWKPRKYHLTLDVSVPEVHAPEIWDGFRDVIGGQVNGSGVVIGIIDTGIDYRHPDFWFPNGSTKILSIWDQTIDGKPPRGFKYGYECSRWEIEAMKCPERDETGHGTHVASIAAGTGLASYKGVAPGAYLIVVKTGYPVCGGLKWFMEEDKILDGISYIVEKARELGLRPIINLSLGSDNGGHDGHTPLEKVIDELTDEGVIFVVAAGNSASDQIHSMGDLAITGEVEVKWVLQPATKELDLSYVTEPDDEVRFSLKTPYGTIEGKEVENYRIGNLVVNITLNYYDSGRDWEITVRSVEGDLSTHGWAMMIEPIKLNGTAVWHSWISSDTCSFSRERFIAGNGYNITESYTVTVPATAKKAIAVGGYVSKSSWYMDGKLVSSGLKLGRLLHFSGRGPSRDGRIKPDLAAPGSVIVAAKPIENFSSSMNFSDYYTARHGTSMAAPHVTGVIALMLQLFPNASFDQIYNALTYSARWEDFMGKRPSNDWGWGKLDARTIYKLRVEVLGLSENSFTEASIDGLQFKVSLKNPLTIPFLNNSEHILIAQKEIPISSLSMYRLETGNKFVINKSMNIILRYNVWHYLDVKSPFGGTEGSGWYREGEEVWFFAPRSITPPIYDLLFKPVLRLSYWITEDGRKLYHPRILMDKPHTVTAIYTPDYGIMVFSWLTIAVGSSAITIILRRHYQRVRRGVEGGKISGQGS